MIAQIKTSEPQWFIERRPNGVLIVRMLSKRNCPNPLPDAVFTFRVGDPQYDYWHRQASLQETQRG
jgi:hypothetical protein